jgi:glutaredoxin
MPFLATSTFCGPCGLLKEHLDSIGAEYEIVDLIKDTAFFTQHNIKSVPCLVIEDGNNIMGVQAITDWFNDNAK